MKTYRFYSLHLVLVLCLAFISCSDDNENGGGTGKSTKRLVRVEVDEGNYATVEFFYSGDKVSRIRLSEIEDEEIVVNENIVVRSSLSNPSENTIYTLGENGYIIADNKGDTYTYYPEGYLKSGLYDFYTYDSHWNLIESKDNISKVTYTDIPNKDQLVLLLDEDPLGEDIHIVLAQAGLLGKSTPFLPKECINDYNSLLTFDYKLDNEGHVEKVIVTYSSGADSPSTWTTSWTQEYFYEEIR